MTRALLSELFPYGASELKRVARPNMVRALTFSSLLGVLTFALAGSLSLALQHSLSTNEPIRRVILELPPPPAILVPRLPAASRPTPKAPIIGVPMPLRDVESPPEEGPRDQGALEQTDGGAGSSPPPPIVATPKQDLVVNRPNTPALVDQLPEPIRRVEPRYPDLAREAQVEGMVVVNVLVAKDGRVQEVQLHPTIHVPMLDLAALEAARQWMFEPALMNGRPVAVWVALPFRFRLR
jgi:periplasmic protein TonB